MFKGHRSLLDRIPVAKAGGKKNGAINVIMIDFIMQNNKMISMCPYLENDFPTIDVEQMREIKKHH